MNNLLSRDDDGEDDAEDGDPYMSGELQGLEMQAVDTSGF